MATLIGACDKKANFNQLRKEINAQSIGVSLKLPVLGHVVSFATMDAKKEADQDSSSNDDKQSSSEEHNHASNEESTRRRVNSSGTKKRRRSRGDNIPSTAEEDGGGSASKISSIATGPIQSAGSDSPHASIEPVIRVPRYRDVLLGRGRGIQTSNGNYLMRETIRKYRDSYSSAPRSKRREISERVLDEILATGARFLRRIENDAGNELWEEVDRSLAHDKVSHALREKKYTYNSANDESCDERQASSSTTAQQIASHHSSSTDGQVLIQQENNSGSGNDDTVIEVTRTPTSNVSVGLTSSSSPSESTQASSTNNLLQNAATILLQNIQQESTAATFFQNLLLQNQQQQQQQQQINGLTSSYFQQPQQQQHHLTLATIAAMLNQQASNTSSTTGDNRLAITPNASHLYHSLLPGIRGIAGIGPAATINTHASAQPNPVDAASSTMAWALLLMNTGLLSQVIGSALHQQAHVESRSAAAGVAVGGPPNNINYTYSVLQALQAASCRNVSVEAGDNSNSSGTNARPQSQISASLHDSRNQSTTGDASYSTSDDDSHEGTDNL